MSPARRNTRRAASRPARTVAPEPLERRALMSVDAAVEAPEADNKAPSVDAIYVNGTEWAQAFRDYLEDRNEGSAEFGYEVDGGGGGDNQILPWINLDQISVRFDEPVSVQQDDLEIESRAGEDYAVVAFSYDEDTNTATWTLAGPIDADVLTLRLDGTGEDAITDTAGNTLQGNDNDGGGGTGRPERDFVHDLAVLPGDTDRSGIVLARDYAEVKQKFFSSTTEERAGLEKYSVFHDVDGSGIILARDFAEVRQRFFTTLPEEEDDDD